MNHNWGRLFEYRMKANLSRTIRVRRNGSKKAHRIFILSNRRRAL